MEIRIDTSKDSREEIRKAIRFLQEIVEGGSGSAGQELPAEGENVMGGIFDLPATGPAISSPSPEITPAVQEAPVLKPTKEKIKYSGFEVY